MGLISEEVWVGLGGNNINYYESLGYEIPRRKDKWGDNSVPRGTKILVKVNDLTNNSNVFVKVKCDGINCNNEFLIKWQDYLKCIKEDNKYYCNKCVHNNGIFISFEEWCIENNRQNILDRWDYELNDVKPNEISFGVTKKYYFKCPRRLHESELKSINSFTNGQEGSIKCNVCNSFAQWGIDNLGEDFLEKYWDYEKNIINPWGISHSANKKIYIKCQNKKYHDSYLVLCYEFLKGSRCPFCTNRNGKVHLLDSLGTLYPEVLDVWSDKNKYSPYKYAPFSQTEVYWKCLDSKHKDYKRKISVSTIYNFRCPECQYSKGEEVISNYLINNNYIKIENEDYNKLDNNFELKHYYYIPQKKFDGLLGLGNGLLSYDFYLPQYNLLIEYQGEQHERYIPGFHKSKKNFEKQVEHDRRKRFYTQEHNINLLEIWYWDFDNIEEILDEYLNKNINCLSKGIN